MEITKITKIKKISKKIIESNTLMIFLLIIVIFSFIVTISLFTTGNLIIQTPWTNEITNNSEYNWLGYLEIVLSFIANLLILIGYILSTRKNKKYIYFSLPGSILFIINAIILGGVFTGISNLGIAIISIWSYKDFAKEYNITNKNYELSSMNKKRWILLIIFWLLYISIFLPIAYIFIYNDFSNSEEIIKGAIDVIASGGLIVAWYVLLKKSKWGLIIFLFADILYIIFFLISGDFISVSNYISFIIIEVIAFIYWWTEEKEHKFYKNY